MSRLVEALRDAPFLTPERIRAYAWLLAVFMAIALGYEFLSTAIGHHPWRPPPVPGGKPVATDFVAFWAAGRAVLQGHPARAYDLAWLSGVEHAASALGGNLLLAFFYPPTFLLVCAAFALVPYMVGFAGFVGVSLTALVVASRRIIFPHAPGAGWLWGALPVLAFPGLLMNAATGQTGFWSAACFAWGLLWLQARPVLAGACLGALVIKPHLALAVPVALLAARRWRALASCAATASLWMALSWVVLGTAAWRGFAAGAPAVRDALEHHREDWGKLQSLFTTFRLWGAPLVAAYTAQILLAGTVLAALALLAWRRPGARAEAAAMTAAAMLCTPHILDYDLAALAVPLTWIACEAARTGWLPWEKLLAGLAFLWPLVARMATDSGVAPIGPFILLGVFGLVWRRVRPARHAPGLDASPC
jgi:alpha-1,2-mannosyltransferase